MNKEEQIVVAKAAYEKAVEVQQSAKKVVDDLKASQDPVTKAFEAARKAYNELRPAMDRAKAMLSKADADVTLTKGDLKALDPKAVPVASGASNKKILEVVQAFLATKPDGATNQDIYDAVIAAGLQLAGDKPRENFTSYLHRWGSANAIVSKGTGVWGVASAQAPAAPQVPSFISGVDQAAPGTTDQTPPEMPAFLGGASTPLDAEFPGYEPLSAAGISTKEALAGKTKDDLTAISGIGEKTAIKILEALAG